MPRRTIPRWTSRPRSPVARIDWTPSCRRARLEQRQRESEVERGRDPDDKPRGGRYKREFGVPEDKAQDNFTDPDSRIMPRAGGGFDPAYNAQTAVDDTAHIIVAAELVNNASDAQELPKMLEAVKDVLGTYPEQTLADAGYRSEAVFQALKEHTELVIAIGREGKSHRPINTATLPLTAAMVEKMKTAKAREAYRRRKWLAEPPNGWIKSVLVPPVQPARSAPGASRMEARVHGTEPATHGSAERKLTRCAGAFVMLTGTSLVEGGWRVRSNTLELPLGGGSGELCVKATG